MSTGERKIYDGPFTQSMESATGRRVEPLPVDGEQRRLVNPDDASPEFQAFFDDPENIDADQEDVHAA